MLLFRMLLTTTSGRISWIRGWYLVMQETVPLMQILLTVQKIPAMVLRMEAAATAVKMEAIPANNI